MLYLILCQEHYIDKSMWTLVCVFVVIQTFSQQFWFDALLIQQDKPPVYKDNLIKKCFRLLCVKQPDLHKALTSTPSNPSVINWNIIWQPGMWSNLHCKKQTKKKEKTNISVSFSAIFSASLVLNGAVVSRKNHLKINTWL